MSVVHSISANSTWGLNVTSRSKTNVNATGTHRFATVTTLGSSAHPTAVSYGGTSMVGTVLGTAVSSLYMRMFGLQDPATGNQTVSATWAASQANAYLGVVVGSSSSGAITVRDAGENTYSGATFDFHSGAMESSTDDLVIGSCFYKDASLNGYGEDLNATNLTSRFYGQEGGGNHYLRGGSAAGASGTFDAAFSTNFSYNDVYAGIIAVSLKDTAEAEPITATSAGESSGGASVSYERISTATVVGEGSSSAVKTALKIVAATVIGVAGIVGAVTSEHFEGDIPVLSSSVGESSPGAELTAAKIGTATVSGDSSGGGASAGNKISSQTVAGEASGQGAAITQQGNQVPFQRAQFFNGTGTFSFRCEGNNRALLLTVPIDVASGTTPAPTYNGTTVPRVGSTDSGEVRYHYYRLLNPASGANNLILDAGTACIAACYSNVASFRTAVLSPFTGGGTYTIEDIASAAAERVASFVVVDSSDPAAVSLTAVSPLKRRAYGYASGQYHSIALGDLKATGALEDVAWTPGGTQPFRGISFSMTPAASGSFPLGDTSIEFLGAGSTTLHCEFSYTGADAPNFEYSLNGGAWVDLGAPNPRELDLSDLTSDEDYTLVIRPYTADGPGDPSTIETVHTEAAAVGTVDYVDSDGGFTAGGGSGPINVTFPLTVENPNPFIIAAVGVLPDDGDTGLTCTFDGSGLTQLHSESLGGYIWTFYVKTNPSVGTFNLVVTNNAQYAENLQVVAASYKGVQSYRTFASITTTSATSIANIPSAVGDRVLAIMAKLENAVTGSSDLTLRVNRNDAGSYVMALGDKTSTGTLESGSFTVTGTSTRIVLGISLEPASGSGGGTEPPTGTVGFDAAVDHKAAALRGLGYTGGAEGDEESAGFRFQHRVKRNNGTYGPATNSVAPYLLDNDGANYAPRDILYIQTRAVNNYGVGDWSAEKRFRLHEAYHRSGARRFSPSTAVGYAAEGIDVVATTPFDGPLTTGGRDRAVLLCTDMAYGTDDPATPLHDFTYDDVQATKFYSYPTYGGREENGGAGGSEGFILTNPSLGQNTGAINWTDPVAGGERTVYMAVTALQNVDQVHPIASFKARLTGNAAPAFPGVDDVPFDPSLDDALPASPGNYNFHVANVPASLDELIVSFLGTYGSLIGSPGVATDTTMFGEAGTGGAAWGGAGSPGERLTRHGLGPDSAGMTVFAGAGYGQICASRMAVFEGGAVPSSTPLHVQRWQAGHTHYGTIVGIAIRPSPNMVHTVTVPVASTNGVQWAGTSEVNHSRVLLAIIPDSAGTPEDLDEFALQLRDAVDGTTEAAEPYGDFVYVGEHEIDEETYAPTYSIGSIIPGQTFGDYKLVTIYETWQWNLGTPILTPFSITVVSAAVSGDLGTAASSAYAKVGQAAVAGSAGGEAAVSASRIVNSSSAGSAGAEGTVSYERISTAGVTADAGVTGDASSDRLTIAQVAAEASGSALADGVRATFAEITGDAGAEAATSYLRIGAAAVEGDAAPVASLTATKDSSTTVAGDLGAGAGVSTTALEVHEATVEGSAGGSADTTAAKLGAGSAIGDAAAAADATYARVSLASIEATQGVESVVAHTHERSAASTGEASGGGGATGGRFAQYEVTGDLGASGDVVAFTEGTRTATSAGEASGGSSVSYERVGTAAVAGEASGSASAERTREAHHAVSGEASGSAEVSAENGGLLPVLSSAQGSAGLGGTVVAVKVGLGASDGSADIDVTIATHREGAATSVGSLGTQGTVVGVKDPTAIYADIYRTVELGDTVEKGIIVTDSISAEVRL